jgi:hypothetical protein
VFFLPELMLLGFISLLLTVFQDLISHICISPKHATQMLPCKRSHESLQGSGHDLINYDTIINRRRLFSTDTGPQHCRQEVRIGEVYFHSFNFAGCYQIYRQRILKSYKIGRKKLLSPYNR